MKLQAHDQPGMALIIMAFFLGVLLLALAGLFIALPELVQSLNASGRGLVAAFWDLPPTTQAAITGIGGAGMIGFGVHLAQKRGAKKVALAIDETGVRTAKSAPPHSALAWADIQSLSINRTMLTFKGQQAIGEKVKLQVNIGQIDVKPKQVYEAIGHYRPDLIG